MLVTTLAGKQRCPIKSAMVTFLKLLVQQAQLRLEGFL